MSENNEGQKPRIMQVGDEILTEVLDDDNNEMVLNENDQEGEDSGEEEIEEGDENALEEVVEEEEGDEEEDMEVESIQDVSVFTFSEHTDSVYAVKIHPTMPGFVGTGGGDDRGFMWRYNTRDTNTRTDDSFRSRGTLVNVAELTGHKDTVASVDFNYDGKFMLTGGYDGKVSIWDCASGALTCVLEGPDDVEWACWHNKGNAVIAGSGDGTVWMWLTSGKTVSGEVGSGQCVQVFAGHDGTVTAGCFTCDGKNVCSGGEDGTVRIWAPKTGICKHTFEGHFGHRGAVTCMSQHASDPELLLTGGTDGTMRLFHVSGKRALQTFVHAIVSGSGSESTMDEGDETVDVTLSVECVGFYCPSQGVTTSNIKYVASGGVNGLLKIWDSNNGQMRSSCVHDDAVTALQWHNIQPFVCTSSVDRIVRLWDARSGVCLLSLTGHRNIITQFHMSPLLLPLPETEGATESESEYSKPTPPLPPSVSGADSGATDVIVTVSDDGTAKVFHINMPLLMQQ